MEYSKAYALAQDIRESEESRTYHALREDVMADETQAALIREYKKLSVQLQAARPGGPAALLRHLGPAVLQAVRGPVPARGDAAAAGHGGHLQDHHRGGGHRSGAARDARLTIIRSRDRDLMPSRGGNRP